MILHRLLLFATEMRARIWLGVLVSCYVIVLSSLPLLFVRNYDPHDKEVPNLFSKHGNTVYAVSGAVGLGLLTLRAIYRAHITCFFETSAVRIPSKWKSVIRSGLAVILYVGGTLLLNLGMIGYFYVFAIYCALLAEAKLASTEDALDIAAMEIESIIGTIFLEIYVRAFSRAVILCVLLVIAVISKTSRNLQRHERHRAMWINISPSRDLASVFRECAAHAESRAVQYYEAVTHLRDRAQDLRINGQVDHMIQNHLEQVEHSLDVVVLDIQVRHHDITDISQVARYLERLIIRAH